MKELLKASAVGLALIILPSLGWAQRQSNAPADRTAAQKVSMALARAGIDPRVTSVQVTTTSGHVVYLTGLIADRQKIKLAGEVAAKAVPSYRIVNNIRASFFADPNHVHGRMTK